MKEMIEKNVKSDSHINALVMSNPWDQCDRLVCCDWR